MQQVTDADVQAVLDAYNATAGSVGAYSVARTAAGKTHVVFTGAATRQAHYVCTLAHAGAGLQDADSLVPTCSLCLRLVARYKAKQHI